MIGNQAIGTLGIFRFEALDNLGPFADNLFQVASTGWQDPIQSGFGWHIVYINEIIESSALPYESVRDQVIEDWRDDNEEYFMNQLIEKLRTQYKVVRDYEM